MKGAVQFRKILTASRAKQGKKIGKGKIGGGGGSRSGSLLEFDRGRGLGDNEAYPLGSSRVGKNVLSEGLRGVPYTLPTN